MWLGIIVAVVLVALVIYQVIGLVKDIKLKKDNTKKDHVVEDTTDKGSEDNK